MYILQKLFIYYIFHFSKIHIRNKNAQKLILWFKFLLCVWILTKKWQRVQRCFSFFILFFSSYANNKDKNDILNKIGLTLLMSKWKVSCKEKWAPSFRLLMDFYSILTTKRENTSLLIFLIAEIDRPESSELERHRYWL